MNYFKTLKLDLILFNTLFFISLYKYIRNTSFLYLYKNGWAFSESLINYSGGFVRRGFFGEILTTYLQPNQILLVNFIVFLLSIFHIIWFINKKLQSENLLFRLVCSFSPFGLIYLLDNLDQLFGRKDFLILNFIIYLLNKERFSQIDNLFIILTSTILSLNYELFLLVLPLMYFIFKSKRDIDYSHYLLISFLFLVNVLLIFQFNSAKNFKLLCNDINSFRTELNLNNKGCWGAPNYLNDLDKIQQIEEVFVGLVFNNNLIFWIITFSLFFIFTYILGLKFKEYISIFSISILFLVSIDYGRWFFLLFLVTILIKKEITQYNSKLNIYLSLVLISSGLFVDIPTYLYQDIDFIDTERIINYLQSIIF